MRSIYMSLILFAVVAAPGCILPMSAATTSGKPTLARTVAPTMVPTTVANPSVPEAPVVVQTEAILPDAVVAPQKSEDREKAVAWMVGFMVRNAPPGRQTFYAEAQETKEEALERYNGIANAIIDVVYAPDTKPLFAGSNGRSRTASVILAIMLYESGFMKNVDFGTGKLGRGDGGRSYCLLQLQVGGGKTIKWNKKYDRLPKAGDDPNDIFDGYTGPELVQDRHKCVGESLKALRVSFNSCPGLPLDQALRMYGSGNCEGAERPSRLRMQTAFKFWENTRDERTFSDKAITDTFTVAAPTPVASPHEPELQTVARTYR